MVCLAHVGAFSVGALGSMVLVDVDDCESVNCSLTLVFHIVPVFCRVIPEILRFCESLDLQLHMEKCKMLPMHLAPNCHNLFWFLF